MTTRHAISPTKMCEILKQELATTEQLKQLLAAEQTAITAHDIPAFEEVIDRKRLILERLAQQEQQRILLLESYSIKHGPESMVDCIKNCHDDNRLSDLWQRLLTMAADCREHNRQNHQLVGLLSAHTSKALHILRGEAMEQDIYGPDGDTRDPHGNRSLAIV
jgi:flagellar biosynthesis/type III secretory pathway chaperone